MTRFASFALIGAAAIGLSLNAPETARAQSFGLHLDVGAAHIDVGHGHHHHGRQRHSYYGYGHSHRQNGYGDYGQRGYGYYGDSYYSPYRQPIVVPEYYHWTPGRGYHSHGTIVTPHRGHYHTRPY